MAVIVLLGLLADQTSKFLAVDRLTVALQREALTLGQKVERFYTLRHLERDATEPYVVFAPWWRMSYAENPGAAWGLFRSLSAGARQTFFSLVSLAAIGFILFYYRRLEPGQRLLQVALSMVLAGALGNFVDRLARGYVVDFIDWHWWNRPDLRWPTFNVADSLIVVGVAILFVHPGSRKDAAAARE